MPRSTQPSHLYFVDHVLGKDSFFKEAITEVRWVQVSHEISPVALKNLLVEVLHSQFNNNALSGGRQESNVNMRTVTTLQMLSLS